MDFEVESRGFPRESHTSCCRLLRTERPRLPTQEEEWWNPGTRFAKKCNSPSAWCREGLWVRDSCLHNRLECCLGRVDATERAITVASECWPYVQPMLKCWGLDLHMVVLSCTLCLLKHAPAFPCCLHVSVVVLIMWARCHFIVLPFELLSAQGMDSIVFVFVGGLQQILTIETLS